MKKKITKSKPSAPKRARARARRSSKNNSSSAAPLIIGGVCVAAILVVVLIAASGKDSSNPANNTGKVTEVEETVNEFGAASVETQADSKKTESNEEAVEAKAETSEVVVKQFTPTAPKKNSEVSDKRAFLQFQLAVRELALKKQWQQAYAKIDSYKGPYANEVAELRSEVQKSQRQYENFDTAVADTPKNEPNNEVAKVEEKKQEKPENPEKPKLKPLGDKKSDRGPNGFLYMTDREKNKIVNADPVTLVVHSEIVGLPGDVIVVWKDRQLVLSYSRLIKNCENKQSKYYEERVQKAKDFLEEHKGEYELIPYAKAKMTLRRRGFTVSEVFFDDSVKYQEDYATKSQTDRYKGYIISYDIRQGSGGVSMGC